MNLIQEHPPIREHHIAREPAGDNANHNRVPADELRSKRGFHLGASEPISQPQRTPDDPDDAEDWIVGGK